jgi:hypothetical protein
MIKPKAGPARMLLASLRRLFLTGRWPTPLSKNAGCDKPAIN